MGNKQLVKENFHLTGMGCVACADRITKVINEIEGVEECIVNYALEEAKVSYNENLTDNQTISLAVKKAGYQADVITTQTDPFEYGGDN